MPKEEQKNHKLVIYQLFTRLFANQNTTNTHYGSIEENGVSKFKDINKSALNSIKKLGATHVWFTGVIEHATCTNYSKFGIEPDHPSVVKGKAGSPYAIKDYYDVDPDLATDVNKRMAEFESLIKRTHNTDLKVLIDFVPNHLARQYKSDKLPKGLKDFGATDDPNTAFLPNNNYYYLPNDTLHLAKDIEPPVKFSTPYSETPAKVTGNDVFSSYPTVNDWYETIKLNYGVDYLDDRKTFFKPIPDTWIKMKDILIYWTKKGVDGFRCDMAEMVPVEFWEWVIPEVKKEKKDIIFIAEIYKPEEYSTYINKGKFDYLYDKVGLYDALRRLIEGNGNAEDITRVWQNESGDFSEKMLRFLENHDEHRIASEQFAGNPERAFPAMALSATLNNGPVMIYYGQELGVNPNKAEGFQGNDGRTTIFDYWGVEELQSWINKGKFTDTKLSNYQLNIRNFYKKLLNFSRANEAISEGKFYDLNYLNSQVNRSRVFSYLRYTKDQTFLFVFNFDQHETQHFKLNLLDLEEANLSLNQKYSIKDVFWKAGKDQNIELKDGVNIELPQNSFNIYQIEND